MANQVGNQVKLVYKSSAAVADDSSKGQLVFDPTQRRLWVDGADFYMYNDNYQGDGYTLHIQAAGTDVSVFDQAHNASITFEGTSPISVAATSNTITVSHTASRHIPEGGAVGQLLTVDENDNPKWMDTSIGTGYRPVYLNGGVFEEISYDLSTNVPANSKFTDTTYDAPGLIGTSRFVAADSSLSVTYASNKYTVALPSGRTIPTDSSITEWESFHDWVDSSVYVDGTTTEATGSTTDNALNTWKDIKNFLAGINDSSTLANKLMDKDVKAHETASDAHAIVSTSADGFVTQIPSTTATTSVASSNLVLVARQNATSASWYKLNANAFSNSTYSAKYTEAGQSYQPSAAKTVNYTSAASAAPAVTAANGTVTFKGMSVIAAPANATAASTNAGVSTSAYNAAVESQTYFWQSA